MGLFSTILSMAAKGAFQLAKENETVQNITENLKDIVSEKVTDVAEGIQCAFNPEKKHQHIMKTLEDARKCADELQETVNGMFDPLIAAVEEAAAESSVGSQAEENCSDAAPNENIVVLTESDLVLTENTEQ